MATPVTMESYFAALKPAERTALTKLRQQIRSTVPKAEKGISYGVPTFRLGDKMLVSFGAAKNHCSFYPEAYPMRGRGWLAGVTRVAQAAALEPGLPQGTERL